MMRTRYLATVTVPYASTFLELPRLDVQLYPIRDTIRHTFVTLFVSAVYVWTTAETDLVTG
jgi:hypothetical protein